MIKISYIALIIFLILIVGCSSPVQDTQQESEPNLNYDANTTKIRSELETKENNVLKVDESEPTLNYDANTIKIRSELEAKGYNVLKVDFTKNPNNKYVINVLIDTEGNYDKETDDMFKVMFDNAVADYYLAGISDYEIQSSWSFTATQKTLDDFFSGKITKEEYIRKTDSERLI